MKSSTILRASDRSINFRRKKRLTEMCVRERGRAAHEPPPNLVAGGTGSNPPPERKALSQNLLVTKRWPPPPRPSEYRLASKKL